MSTNSSEAPLPYFLLDRKKESVSKGLSPENSLRKFENDFGELFRNWNTLQKTVSQHESLLSKIDYRDSTTHEQISAIEEIRHDILSLVRIRERLLEEKNKLAQQDLRGQSIEERQLYLSSYDDIIADIASFIHKLRISLTGDAFRLESSLPSAEEQRRMFPEILLDEAATKEDYETFKRYQPDLAEEYSEILIDSILIEKTFTELKDDNSLEKTPTLREVLDFFDHLIRQPEEDFSQDEFRGNVLFLIIALKDITTHLTTESISKMIQDTLFQFSDFLHNQLNILQEKSHSDVQHALVAFQEALDLLTQLDNKYKDGKMKKVVQDTQEFLKIIEEMLNNVYNNAPLEENNVIVLIDEKLQIMLNETPKRNPVFRILLGKGSEGKDHDEITESLQKLKSSVQNWFKNQEAFYVFSQNTFDFLDEIEEKEDTNLEEEEGKKNVPEPPPTLPEIG